MCHFPIVAERPFRDGRSAFFVLIATLSLPFFRIFAHLLF